MNINNTDWMQSANVKLAVYVLIGIMPAIVADLAQDRVSWLSAATVFSSALITGKAYMSDPTQARGSRVRLATKRRPQQIKPSPPYLGEMDD